ncbi:MAG: hypothetical protein FWG39_03620 [Alphaproteobacteria bacterium]|nr:hypothetical protein [Alphaproteobacteria bacterium]
MKPAMLFSVIAIIVIVILTAFSVVPGEWLGVGPVAHNLGPSVDLGIVLYVCPVQSGAFDELSRSFLMFREQIKMFFMGLLLFLALAIGWAFYQNLIKDKFDYNSWRFAISFAKTLFWGAIIVVILMYSPNFFKTVGVRGAGSKYVLCERDTPGSRPVRQDAVMPQFQRQTGVQK